MDDKKAEEIATKYPGFINYSGQLNGHYSGAKLLWFPSPEAVNDFFEANQHVIVVSLLPDHRGGYSVVYTVQLESKHLKYLAEWNEKVNDYIAMREEQDAAEEIQAAVDAEKGKEEMARLAALGRKCEQNHKKIKEKK